MADKEIYLPFFMPKNNSRQASSFWIFFLLFFAITLVYSNALNSPWILDDKPNILDNQPLHLTELSLQSITRTFYAYPESSGKLFRPLSCLTFGLNWYWGQDRVMGYHLVNIGIHILVSFFLYLCCILILSTPAISGKYSPYSKHLIALITALLWSLNPVQTQAVTYIVQRMAALAALFSIIGIYFFLKARLSSSLNKKILFFILCLVSFFCALASKENSILLPISLLLIELIFFNSISNFIQILNKRKKVYYTLIASNAGVFFLLGIYYIAPYLDYSNRTFSLTERLLTEPKILLFYLSQLLFPHASRLSVEHDFVLSTSLFTPLDTFVAICICIMLLGLGCIFTKKSPLLSLALLFFFLNHIVESTILPLELIFEHRNYLPSLFLFLPVAAFLTTLANRKNKNLLPVISPLIVTVLIIFFGYNTYVRNVAWASELSLWEDAYSKAPNNSRAATNLAKEYMHTDRLKHAFILFRKSYSHPQSSKHYSEAISLHGEGVVYNMLGRGSEAVELFQKSLNYVPDYYEARKNLVLSLMKLNRLQEALANFQGMDSKTRFHHNTLQGIILLRLNQPLQALEVFRSAPKRVILSIEIMQGIGQSMSMMGHYGQADFFLRQTAKFSLLGALSQIKNLQLAGELEQSRVALNAMFSNFPAQAILDYITINNPLDFPLDRQSLYPLVMQHAKEIFPKGSM